MKAQNPDDAGLVKATSYLKIAGVVTGLALSLAAFLVLCLVCIAPWTGKIPVLGGTPLPFATLYSYRPSNMSEALATAKRQGSWRQLLKDGHCCEYDDLPRAELLCECLRRSKILKPAKEFDCDTELPADAHFVPMQWTADHTTLAKQCLLHTQPHGRYEHEAVVSVASALLTAMGANLVFFLFYAGNEIKTRAKDPPAHEEHGCFSRLAGVLCSLDCIKAAWEGRNFLYAMSFFASLVVAVITAWAVYYTMYDGVDGSKAAADPPHGRGAFFQAALAGVYVSVSVLVVFLVLQAPQTRNGPQGISVGYLWNVHAAMVLPLWSAGWQALLGSREVYPLMASAALVLAGCLAPVPYDFLAPLLTSAFQNVHSMSEGKGHFATAGGIAAATVLVLTASVVLLYAGLWTAAPMYPWEDRAVNGGGSHTTAVLDANLAPSLPVHMHWLYYIAVAPPLALAVFDWLSVLVSVQFSLSLEADLLAWARDLAGTRPWKPTLFAATSAASAALLAVYLH